MDDAGAEGDDGAGTHVDTLFHGGTGADGGSAADRDVPAHHGAGVEGGAVEEDGVVAHGGVGTQVAVAADVDVGGEPHASGQHGAGGQAAAAADRRERVDERVDGEVGAGDAGEALGDLHADARVADAEDDGDLTEEIELVDPAEQGELAVGEQRDVGAAVVEEAEQLVAAGGIDDVGHLAPVAARPDDHQPLGHGRTLRAAAYGRGVAEPVRVLQLIKGLGPGGAERLLVSMAAVADPAAVHYEVAYLLDRKQHLVPELEALGVTTHLLAGPRGMGDPRWPRRLRALARRFDVVHVHSPAVGAVARVALAPMRHGPVLVSTEHNVWPSHGAATRVANAVTLPLDRQRWAVSAEVVASSWPRWRAHTEVLVHGAPVGALVARTRERAEARQRHGWADDDVVVAHVANLRHHKDHRTLFAAATLAIAEEPRLRFVSIGQGPLEAELRAALAEHDLGDRFELLGYHPDPPAVLAGADLFTLSSIHEGLPISLIEAMAMGLAPVVTRAGGNEEVVTDTVDGIVVEPKDPAALAAAYLELAHDDEHRRGYGTAASSRAEDFDIARTARIVEARYRQLVDRA